jgi:hypothetical protein
MVIHEWKPINLAGICLRNVGRYRKFQTIRRKFDSIYHHALERSSLRRYILFGTKNSTWISQVLESQERIIRIELNGQEELAGMNQLTRISQVTH